ncbi:cytidine deaminase [Aliiroseovarius sp.]|uniref:cytidine deaminase n=1 Tax=Aliiroseovarius sp. TaxID=1872442 RepID=UPI003BAD1F6C
MSLLDAAKRARENAHAPYSNFKVGAAVRTASGDVYAGCNVENVAYPEGTCAEAGAIAAMVMAGQREITEALVIADAPLPVTPCGGCRQKLKEFAGPDTKVTMLTTGGAELVMTMAELLPGAFTNEHLDNT